MVQEIETTDFTPEFITLEVGSRGPFNPAGFKDLRAHINVPLKEWNTMLTGLTRTVIIESH